MSFFSSMVEICAVWFLLAVSALLFTFYFHTGTLCTENKTENNKPKLKPFKINTLTEIK